MNKDKITLVKLLDEIINEVGDFNNIIPYEYDQSGFILSDGYKVDVKISELGNNIIDIPPIFNPYDNKIYNLSFNVEGDDAQFKKSNYAELIKILKTVVEILKDKIEILLKGSIFTILASDKKGNISMDKQKFKLYKSIISKNIPSDYRIGTGVLGDWEVIIIQK